MIASSYYSLNKTLLDIKPDHFPLSELKERIINILLIKQQSHTISKAEKILLYKLKQGIQSVKFSEYVLLTQLAIESIVNLFENLENTSHHDLVKIPLKGAILPFIKESTLEFDVKDTLLHSCEQKPNSVQILFEPNEGTNTLTIRIVIDNNTLTNSIINMANSHLIYTFTFDKPVTHFDTTDIFVMGGIKGIFTAISDKVYTLEISLTPEVQAGNIIIDLKLETQDGTLVIGSHSIQNYDTSPPVVNSIVMSNASLQMGQTSTVTITFSEPVTHFDNNNVIVQNGTLSTLTSSDGGITWTGIFTPSSSIISPINTISINPNYTDIAGNTGSSATSSNYTINTLNPTVRSIIMSDTILKAGESCTVTITFSEAVTNFDNTDVAAQNGTLSILTTNDGGITWTAIFTPTVDIEDPTNIIIVTNTYTDIAGNTGSSGTSDNYIVDTKSPIVSSITLSNTQLKVGDTSNVTITFSEAVNNFDNTDVIAQNGVLNTLTSIDGGITWTAVFTPSLNIEDGTNIITVNDTYTDIVGNIGTSSTSGNYTIDTKAPTVNSITLSKTALKIGDTATVTITFSEAVTGFDNSDVTVQNGTLSTLSSSDGGITWTGTFTPTTNIQNVTNAVSIAATYTDVAGNAGSTGTSSNYTIDTKAPTVSSIVMSKTALKIGDTATVTITFSEAVTGFDNSDVTVQNGTLSTLTSSDGGITWTGTFTPTTNIQNATNAVSIAATYTDVAGNAGSTGTSSNYTIDTKAPTVSSITLSKTALKIGDTATVTIIFSEAVTGFDNSDVTVQNGTLSTLVSSDGGVTWTGTFTPTTNIQNATNAVSIAATYTDLAGNTGSTGNSSNYTIDTKAPTVSSITLSKTALKIGDTATVTITFSEAVTGFDNSDVTVQNGTLSTLASSDGGITWTGTFTPTTNIQNATNAVSIAATYTDVAGNAGSTGTSSNYTIDTKAPTVSSITLSKTALKIGDTATVTITFSEAVTGFDNSDVTVQNGTLSTLTSSDGGITWTGTFTPTTNIQNATNAVSIAATYTDVAGNTGSTGTSSNYTIDTKAPTVSSITLSKTTLKIGDTATVTIAFSEAVTGFDNSDVTVQNGTLSTLSSSDGGITWTGTFTPTVNIQNSLNTITVASTYTDTAGNAGSGSSTTYTVDTRAPSVSSIVLSDVTISSGETPTVLATFSEAVTNFDNSDVTAPNGTLSTLSSSNGGITWSGIFTPTVNVESPTNVITIASTYTDIAGNTGSSGTSANYAVDTKAPTVSSILMSSNALKIGDTPTVTITFSEAVTGFDNSDVTTPNGTLSTITTNDSGKTWIGTFTPTANIENNTNVISVASTYTDIAGNAGTTGTGSNYTIDTQAPTISISSNVPPNTIIYLGNILYTFTFSEPVTGFTNSDILVTGGSKLAFTTISSSVYTLLVDPTLVTYIIGGITITIAAGALQDLAGNPNLVKNYTDNSIGILGASKHTSHHSLSLSEVITEEAYYAVDLEPIIAPKPQHTADLGPIEHYM